jgi:prophage regulatory protein
MERQMNNVSASSPAGTVSALPRAIGAPSTSERLIRLPQVLDMVGLGKTTVYAMIKDGNFPQPRKVRGLSVWVESEVQNWVRSVVAAPVES